MLTLKEHVPFNPYISLEIQLQIQEISLEFPPSVLDFHLLVSLTGKLFPADQLGDGVMDS